MLGCGPLEDMLPDSPIGAHPNFFHFWIGCALADLALRRGVKFG